MRLEGRQAAEVGVSVALAAVVAAVALAFAWPWLPGSAAGGDSLERYAPLRDGASMLVQNLDAEGRHVSWESQNIALVPGLKAISGLPGAQQDALRGFFSLADDPDVRQVRERMAGAQVVERRSRTLTPDGGTTEASSISVRGRDGDSLVVSRDSKTGEDIVVTPAIKTLPLALEPGAKPWAEEGRYGELDYKLEGRVLRAASYDGALGDFDDCVEVDLGLALSQGGEPIEESRFEDLYCAGAGLVESRQLDEAGLLVQRQVVVATDRILGRAPTPPVGALAAQEVPPKDPAAWERASLGSVRPFAEGAEGTVAPVWVPTDPPLLLAAGLGGDLVALDPTDASGKAVWRFHTGGSIYGEPVFDPRSGRIFFGSTDKRLYALDAHGLFLWSFEAGDSIASRPVVVGEAVVFGSEDREVYGLDASTGERRWSFATGGPVVSSPALAGGVVVVGSDDGAAYGLDASTGEKRWLRATGGPVEADVVAEDGIAYVASRAGTLLALDAKTGEPVWRAEPGGVLRSAPVVGEEHVFVVDSFGHLTALDKENGRELWEAKEDRYSGTPAVVGETLVVAGVDGAVHRFGLDGKEEESWAASAVDPVSGLPPAFDLGPTVGGGAIWLVDDRSGIHRVGPPDGLDGPTLLPTTWVRQFIEEPFGGSTLLNVPAVQYRGEALVLGSRGEIYLLDEATGEGRRAGGLRLEGLPVTDPVVEGDVLIVATGDTLRAAGLPDGAGLWEFRGDGTSMRPPTVVGEDDVVLWISAEEGDLGRASGTLHAIDLATGKPRWEAPLSGGFGFAGGAVEGNGTVFAGTPPVAFDLRTGEEKWRADLGEDLSIGGPATDGETLFVGLTSPDGSTGTVRALDAASGEEEWRADLGGEPLDPTDALYLSGDLLVVPTVKGKVIGLDAASGEERWRYEPPAPLLGNVTTEGGRVWLALEDGRVIGLDAESGKPVALSEEPGFAPNTSFYGRPVVVGEQAILPVGVGVVGVGTNDLGEGGERP